MEEGSGSASQSDQSEQEAADLQKILDEDDSELFDALHDISQAERRAELDRLLEQADALAAPTKSSLSGEQAFAGDDVPSSDDGGVDESEAREPAAAEQHAASAAAAAAAAASCASAGSCSHVPPAAASDQPPAFRWIHRGVASLLHTATLDVMAAEVAETLERGRPTALAIHTTCVAVGMSRGGVLVYDRRQSLRTILWDESRPARSTTSLASSLLGASVGGLGLGSGGGHAAAPLGAASLDAVTAVRILDGPPTMLLAGHASGRLVLWDLASAAVLKECAPPTEDWPCRWPC